ncbi:MAG TPA: response regulator transcription factor [Ktedonobacteraceae bacterium]|nr:response regulator transcription factor [Ktedonobacteraceae bacterium]
MQKKKREILRFADIELDRQTHSVYCGSHMLTLTPTEYKLLALFLQNPSFVLERDHIMEQIWGVAAVELNTVDVHVGGLRKKLEAKGARLIHTIRGVGYVLKEATNKI